MELGFDTYQSKIKKYDLFNCDTPKMKDGSIALGADGAVSSSVIEKILGLAGEGGEVLDKFKKIIRDKDGIVSPEDREEIGKELGDTLWYVATVARYLDIPLSKIAEKNLDKLESRFERGKLSGSGDNR